MCRILWKQHETASPHHVHPRGPAIPGDFLAGLLRRADQRRQFALDSRRHVGLPAAAQPPSRQTYASRPGGAAAIAAGGLRGRSAGGSSFHHQPAAQTGRLDRRRGRHVSPAGKRRREHAQRLAEPAERTLSLRSGAADRQRRLSRPARAAWAVQPGAASGFHAVSLWAFSLFIQMRRGGHVDRPAAPGPADAKLAGTQARIVRRQRAPRASAGHRRRFLRPAALAARRQSPLGPLADHRPDRRGDGAAVRAALQPRCGDCVGSMAAGRARCFSLGERRVGRKFCGHAGGGTMPHRQQRRVPGRR